MRRSSAIAVAAVSALALPVFVQAESQPEARSPAGAVYEIPLQTARDYGAPRGGATPGGSSVGGTSQGGSAGSGGSGNGAGGSGTTVAAGSGVAKGVLPGDAVKTENGYGASSVVPGLAAVLAATRSTGHDSHANPAKAESRISATAASAASAGLPRITVTQASASAPSLGGAYALVLLIVLGGAAAGVAAALATRRAQGR